MSYIISLVVGLAFGIGYGLLGVKSPAPPIVALFGLLGMVIGEQGVPWVKHQIQSPQHVPSSREAHHLVPQMKIATTATEADDQLGMREVGSELTSPSVLAALVAKVRQSHHVS